MVSQQRGVWRYFEGCERFCTKECEYPVAKAMNEMQPIKSWALSCTCIDRGGGGFGQRVGSQGLKLNFMLEPQMFCFLSSRGEAMIRS